MQVGWFLSQGIGENAGYRWHQAALHSYPRTISRLGKALLAADRPLWCATAADRSRPREQTPTPFHGVAKRRQ